jgi:hypothetical protein
VLPFHYILWQKDIADGVLTSRWELHAELRLADTPNKLVWHSDKNSCAVSGIRLASTRASVIHIYQDRVCIHHDLVTGFPLDVGNKANTARILFQIWIV